MEKLIHENGESRRDFLKKSVYVAPVLAALGSLELHANNGNGNTSSSLKGNNGFGNGDQSAPGNSLTNNNAENATGTNNGQSK